MKIIGIEESLSDHNQVVLITEPALTREVFDDFSQTSSFKDSFVRYGNFLATANREITSVELARVAAELTNSEKNVEQAAEEARVGRQESLEGSSQVMGLPLMKKPLG